MAMNAVESSQASMDAIFWRLLPFPSCSDGLINPRRLHCSHSFDNATTEYLQRTNLFSCTCKSSKNTNISNFTIL